MSTKKINLTTAILLSLLMVWGCQSAGNQVAQKPGTSKSQTPLPRPGDINLPKGLIGLSMQVGAERVGDTALLYVAHVHPEGPAQQAGIKHGDQVVTVNDAPVTGMTYGEVLRMMRGEPGTGVRLELRRGEEVRDIAITRVATEKLYQ